MEWGILDTNKKVEEDGSLFHSGSAYVFVRLMTHFLGSFPTSSQTCRQALAVQALIASVHERVAVLILE